MQDTNYVKLFGEAAKKRCVEVAQLIVDEAKINASRFEGGTGRLREGYQATPDGRGARISNPLARYWAHVEYGHAIYDGEGLTITDETGKAKRVGQKPHVRPAIETVRHQLARDES